MTESSKPSWKHRLAHEVARFGLMFLYLWVVFVLFVLLEKTIRGQVGLDYQAQGFALINALVLAKVMLIAEDLELGHRTRAHPIAVAVLVNAALFMVVFIAFHVLESLIAGALHGASLAASVPAFGSGGFAGLVTVAAIMFIMLLPYFAIRDIGEALGPGVLRKLFFARPSGAGG